jgi:hypothetical protein
MSVVFKSFKRIGILIMVCPIFLAVPFGAHDLGTDSLQLVRSSRGAKGL